LPTVPLFFALGTFLSLSYYALDHNNPENRRRKERVKAMYPYVHWCSHLEHGHALPLLLLHTATMDLPSSSILPTAADACSSIGPYILFYVVVVHVNQAATGMWPYAVIDDVTRLGGAILRSIFFAFLAALFVALGVGGVALLQLRRA
jgi:hypothetical protein